MRISEDLKKSLGFFSPSSSCLLREGGREFRADVIWLLDGGGLLGIPPAPRGLAGCVPKRPQKNHRGIHQYFSFDVLQGQLGLHGAQLEHRFVDRVVHNTTGNAEFSRHILWFSAMEFDRFKDHKNSW